MKIRSLLSWVALAALSQFCIGCATWFTPETQDPMPAITYKAAQPTKNRAPVNIVFLPGIGDTATDFSTEDFVSISNRRLPRAGITAADAHFGYYKERNMVERMHEGVITPLAEQGPSQIWLAGISLGGMGSVLYTRQFPDSISGLILIAPYLGEDELIKKIQSSGGPSAWYNAGTNGDDDEMAELWRWLIENQNAGDTALPIYLLRGEQDKFSEAHRLLAGFLPEQQVLSLPGSHSWVAWRGLWSRFLLQQNLLTRAAR